jgi:uncharacterized repeat protein (TIGR03803 family)
MERVELSGTLNPISFPKAIWPILTIALALVALSSNAALAQTYNVIYNFTRSGSGPTSAGGWGPTAGLTMDAAGNLYGTTLHGGYSQTQYCPQDGCGTVFKLSRESGGWVLTTLYSFQGGADGSNPAARVIFGPDGALYGTTQDGNPLGLCVQSTCGTVFSLRPPARVCSAVNCPWTKTLLYRFTGQADGSVPGYGEVVFDQAGNLYGTTQSGGPNGGGAVYQLMRGNGSWREKVLYSFNGNDGLWPIGALVFDHAGNLWGTAAFGGEAYQPPLYYYGWGVIFELSATGFNWAETSLYEFNSVNGALPYAALTVDSAGNLFGTTGAGGSGMCYRESEDYGGCGSVFRFVEGSPETIYSFPGNQVIDSVPVGPQAPVTIDESGNLYGTSYLDGNYNAGNIFKLNHGMDGWTYTSLHDFGSGSEGSDGVYPISSVTIDSHGDLYGTATAGGNVGSSAGGVVWEITP